MVHLHTLKVHINTLYLSHRRLMVVERKLLTEGWKAIGKAKFEYMAGAVEVKDNNVIINYLPKYKVNLQRT